MTEISGKFLGSILDCKTNPARAEDAAVAVLAKVDERRGVKLLRMWRRERLLTLEQLHAIWSIVHPSVGPDR